MVHLERQTMNVLASEKRQWQERFNACLLHLNEQIQQSAELVGHDCSCDCPWSSSIQQGWC